MQSGSDLGPGQYKVNGKGYKSALDHLGSQNFKSPSRKDLFASAVHENPGPGDYISEQQLNGNKVEKVFSHNFAFGQNVKQKRFGSNETEVPGPGQYDSTGTVVVKE